MTESPGALALRESRAMNADINPGALTGAQLKFISATDFVPAGLRGNLPAIAACVATGRALGLADMQSLRSIFIVDGKASFSAELMVSLARKAGHSIVGDTSPTRVTVTGTRADNGDTMSVTWTLEDAERIGLLKKRNWQLYGEDMLWARAASALCRRLFADCFAGATYTPEELGYGDVTADELLDEAPSLEPGTAAAASPQTGEPPLPQDEASGHGGDGQQAGATAVSADAAAPVPDNDPEPGAAAIEDGEIVETDWQELAATVVPFGTYKDSTLAAVAGTPDGRDWLAWALRNEGRCPAGFYPVLVEFVENAPPELGAAA